MKATRFVSIPFHAIGYQVTLENMAAVATWCDGKVQTDERGPHVLVPVARLDKNPNRYKAYVGMWVTLSVKMGEKSFKVYRHEWLRRYFMQLPDDYDIPSDEIPDDQPIPTDRSNVHEMSAHPRSKPTPLTVFRNATV